jgi:hypothetical protein
MGQSHVIVIKSVMVLFERTRSFLSGDIFNKYFPPAYLKTIHNSVKNSYIVCGLDKAT